MINEQGVSQRLKNIERECINELIEKDLTINGDILKKMIIEKVNKIKFKPAS